MKKIFIDTNVWLRGIVNDNQQAKDCSQLIEAVESGRFAPYTSTIVLLETIHTLKSYYKIKYNQIIKDVETLLKTRGLSVIEITNFSKALKLHKKVKIKLTDCLIATQLPPRTTLVTYDRDFKKIPKLNPQTPKQILEKINTS